MHRAHRAAQPEKFPVSEDVKELYPPSGNVKDGTRTPVHLQVYDGKRCLTMAVRMWNS